MKKILLSGFVIIAFLAYAYHQQNEGADASQVVVPTAQNNSNSLNVSATSTPAPTGAGSSTPPIQSGQAPTSTPAQSFGQYKDGSYTGSVEDAFYGNVQVQVKIQNGKITDVQFLQYPNDRGTSIEINNQAMPYLKQEALVAQNANVDIVSGATQTSEAFQQSLGNALAQAKG